MCMHIHCTYTLHTLHLARVFCRIRINYTCKIMKVYRVQKSAVMYNSLAIINRFVSLKSVHYQLHQYFCIKRKDTLQSCGCSQWELTSNQDRVKNLGTTESITIVHFINMHNTVICNFFVCKNLRVKILYSLTLQGR